MDDTTPINDPFSARLSRLASMFRPDTTTRALVDQWRVDNAATAAELRAIADDLDDHGLALTAYYADRIRAVAARLEE